MSGHWLMDTFCVLWSAAAVVFIAQAIRLWNGPQ